MTIGTEILEVDGFDGFESACKKRLQGFLQTTDLGNARAVFLSGTGGQILFERLGLFEFEFDL